jgi:GH24 family phage-related lysozyme (muramidase)
MTIVPRPRRQVNFQALYAQVGSDLERHEAFRRYAYPDPLSLLARKYRRLPWGFKPARQLLAQIPEGEEHGIPWTVGIGFAVGVTPDHIMELPMARQKLKEKLVYYWNELTKVIPDINEHPFVIQTVFLNMIFNLGRVRLSKFENTLRFLRERNYAQVADNLEKSLWHRQVGGRAVELVERVRTNTIKQEHLVRV